MVDTEPHKMADAETCARRRRGAGLGHCARYSAASRLLSAFTRCSLVIVLGFVAAGGSVACEKRATDEKTLQQQDQQPAEQRVQRIAVLSPAAAVILRDLGVGEQIVARHAFDAATRRELSVVGDQAGIDYEALLAAKPTHVVMQWGARELPARLAELAKMSSWRVIDVNPVSIADVRKTVAQLAQFVDGNANVWQRASELDAQLAGIDGAKDAAIHDESKLDESKLDESKRDAQPSGKRVVLLLSTSPFAALGPTSCQAEAVRAAGFVIVPGDAKAYVELSSEELLRLDAEAFVVFSPSADGLLRAEDEAALRERIVAPLRKLGLGEKPVLLITDVESLLPSTSMLRLRRKAEAWGAGRGER